MPELLKGKLALITGSSRGLGLAIARALRAEGANVVINYVKRAEDAERVAGELNGIALRADVGDLEEIREMFVQIEKHYGQPPDIVVNNAVDMIFNGDARAKLDTIEWSAFEAQISTTVRGALNTTKAALPGFEKLGGGRIINIGTNLVQSPVVPYQDYTVAKGALYAFTHSMAAELGPKNITVNMAAGGLLRTTDASAATPEAVFDQVAAITPLRKVTTPEDMAGAVVFFASPFAKAITGQQLIVDGGLCMT